MTVPERLARIETTLDSHGEILQRIDTTLNGNGAAGLKTRVDRLEGKQSRAGAWFDRGWKFIAAVILIWLASTHAGCVPASKRLAASLTDVQASVVSARESLHRARRGVSHLMASEEASEPVKAALEPVVAHLDAAGGHLESIGEAAASAQEASAGMKDTQNEWIGPLKIGGVVVIMGLGVVVLLRSGAFLIVKPILKRIGQRLAPKPAEAAGDPPVADLTPEARPPPA